MKVAITGGAGYLGSVLTEKLLDKGYEVCVLDNFLYGKESLEDLLNNPNLTIIDGDIRDLRNVVKSLNGSNAIIHLASIVGDQAGDLEAKTTTEINYLATKNIAELCQMYGKKMLFASTCSVYGDESKDIMAEDFKITPVPISLYGETKLKSEQAILSIPNLDVAILRLGTLFGLSKRMRFDLAINLFIAKAMMGEKITVFGGEQCRPFLHIQDAADAFIMALENNWIGLFNVSWKNFQIKEVAETIAKHLNAKVEITKEIVDKRNYKVTTEKVDKLGFKPKRDLKFAIEEIKKAFDNKIIKDYKLPKYSNYKSLFESKELQEKIYVLGPLGERV